ncbi:hypothetical protein T492DRAFT_863015 [Pavlovales sp. CCMP2436]|nr:hypothetical protein T492DRAFT_863015 [Pavlovales sp. CCMP2436]
MGSIPSSDADKVAEKAVKVADKFTEGSSADATKAAEVSANAVAVADKFIFVSANAVAVADKCVFVIGVGIGVWFLCYTIVNLVPAYFPPPPPAPSTKSRQAYHHEAGSRRAGRWARRGTRALVATAPPGQLSQAHGLWGRARRAAHFYSAATAGALTRHTRTHK